MEAQILESLSAHYKIGQFLGESQDESRRKLLDLIKTLFPDGSQEQTNHLLDLIVNTEEV